MPAEGRDLGSGLTQQVARDRGLGNLATPKSVQKLQTALHAKAKAEAGYRFYALYDKISREDMPWWWGYTETVSPRPPRLHRISTIRVLCPTSAGRLLHLKQRTSNLTNRSVE